jgi:F-type H+-transporting ATPase subunit a
VSQQPRKTPRIDEILMVVLLLNGIAVLGAALTGNLPNWPPGPTDIHVPPQTGEAILTFDDSNKGWDLGALLVPLDISISNSIFTTWIVMAIVLGIGLMAARTVAEVPGRLQGFVELITQLLSDFMREAGGHEVVRFLPLFGTLFLFALVSNWLGLVPFVGQIELLHTPTADYHTNLALALTGFVWYQAAGISKNGIGYFTRWINFTGFKDGPLVGGVMILVGIIEFVSEIFRIITLTLRLWGNIWGGEIVLAVLAGLLFVPSFVLPFIGLELFIGFIQAFVFAFLVLLYIILALESHGEGHEEEHAMDEEAHIPTAHAA